MPRAVRFDRYGGLEVLEVVEVPVPEPGPGELLIRVRAAGINPGEALIRDGSLHEMFPATFPSGEGSDLAGVIEQVGEGVNAFATGDEVFGWVDTRSSHAELVVVEASHLAAKPPAIRFEVAGALFVAGCTAWAMVSAVAVSEGDIVVIAGATGGVGVIAVELARHAGATVLGIAGDRNARWLAQHGIVHVPFGARLANRLRAAAREAGHERIDALLDAHGGGYVALGLELGVAPERIDTIVEFAAAQEHGVKAEGLSSAASPEVLVQLAGLIADDRLEVPITRTFPLEQVRMAYQTLANEQPLGKIVLTP